MGTSSSIIIEQVNGLRASHRIAEGHKHTLWLDVRVAKNFFCLLNWSPRHVQANRRGMGCRIGATWTLLFFCPLYFWTTHLGPWMGPIEPGVDPLGPAIGPCKTGMCLLKHIICLFSLNFMIKDYRTWYFRTKLGSSIGEAWNFTHFTPSGCAAGITPLIWYAESNGAI